MSTSLGFTIETLEYWEAQAGWLAECKANKTYHCGETVQNHNKQKQQQKQKRETFTRPQECHASEEDTKFSHRSTGSLNPSSSMQLWEIQKFPRASTSLPQIPELKAASRSSERPLKISLLNEVAPESHWLGLDHLKFKAVMGRNGANSCGSMVKKFHLSLDKKNN